MYLPIPYKISYDTQKYPFREIVSQMLETNGKLMTYLRNTLAKSLVTKNR